MYGYSIKRPEKFEGWEYKGLELTLTVGDKTFHYEGISASVVLKRIRLAEDADDMLTLEGHDNANANFKEVMENHYAYVDAFWRHFGS